MLIAKKLNGFFGFGRERKPGTNIRFLGIIFVLSIDDSFDCSKNAGRIPSKYLKCHKRISHFDFAGMINFNYCYCVRLNFVCGGVDVYVDVDVVASGVVGAFHLPDCLSDAFILKIRSRGYVRKFLSFLRCFFILQNHLLF